jgi:dUTP pyrophosphatase
MQLKILKTKPGAVFPTKAHPSDAGFDITIIDKVKDLGPRTALYGTGLKLGIPEGYWVAVAPRGSISKTGYILANGIGTVDQNYTGEVFVALMKISDSQPDIQLPCKIAQMILKKNYPVELVQVDSLDETDRGEGCLGSSDKKNV